MVGRIQAAKTPDEGEVKMGTYILRRLCFLVGEIALNQLNYLDVNVFNELKRRNYLRQAHNQENQWKFFLSPPKSLPLDVSVIVSF